MREVIRRDESCEAKFLGELCQSIRMKSEENGIGLDDNVVALPTRLSGDQKEYRLVTIGGKRGFVLAIGSLAWGIAVTHAELPLKLGKRAGSDILNSLIRARRVSQKDRSRRNRAGHILIIDHELGIVKSSGALGDTGSGYFSLYESWEKMRKKECRRLYLARDFKRLGLERVNRLPGSCRELWSMYRDAWSKFNQVARLALSKGDLKRNERLILAKAAVYYLGFQYLESRMIESNVRDACIAESEIRYIVTTIEGHPYERMVSRLARSAGKVHIGYVNTPFVRHQHAVLRSKVGSLPHVLVMNSAIDHMRVSKYLETLDKRGCEDIRVVRRKGCYPGMEQVRELMLNRVKRDDRIKVLVVPSGTMKEVKSLLQKMVKCLGVLPDLEVGIRFHPVVKRKGECLARKMIKGLKVEKRVEISKSLSLEECIDESDCVLYISSSAAIKGLLRGAIPINCGKGTERELDPLYFSNKDLDTSKSVIDSLNEVIQMKATRDESLMVEILERYKGLWEGEAPMEDGELAEICGL